MSTPPKRYQDIKEKFPKILDAYEKLGEATHDGPLNHKEVHLIKLAASACIRSEGAVHSHTRRALEAGASVDEIIKGESLTGNNWIRVDQGIDTNEISAKPDHAYLYNATWNNHITITITDILIFF